MNAETKAPGEVSKLSGEPSRLPPSELSNDEAAVSQQPKSRVPADVRSAAAFLGASVVIIGILSLWYLVWPQPLTIQGEADATRVDIAARVDGRILTRPASRGETVAAGQLLLSIENPQLLARLREAEMGRVVAQADLARIEVGTRAETIAARKAAIAAADANATLAQQTYDRTKQLTERDVASIQRLDETTASLDVSKRSLEQAKLAYAEAVAGYTAEERGVARANVVKAEAAVETLKAQVAELQVKSPIGAQVYQLSAELGEYVSPGVPLLTLVDLKDVWLRFDFREDLIRGMKVGDRFKVRIPALGDRVVEVEVRTLATRGEYAGWRATRATGDFDLRTFEVRAYPVTPIPELRPGMSAYAEWSGSRR